MFFKVILEVGFCSRCSWGWYWSASCEFYLCFSSFRVQSCDLCFNFSLVGCKVVIFTWTFSQLFVNLYHIMLDCDKAWIFGGDVVWVWGSVDLKWFRCLIILILLKFCLNFILNFWCIGFIEFNYVASYSF